MMMAVNDFSGLLQSFKPPVGRAITIASRSVQHYNTSIDLICIVVGVNS